MNFVQLCRRYTLCPPSPCAKNKNNKNFKKERKKKEKKKTEKGKKRKKKNPLYSVVQDVGLGQQIEKTYRLRRKEEEMRNRN